MLNLILFVHNFAFLLNHLWSLSWFRFFNNRVERCRNCLNYWRINFSLYNFRLNLALFILWYRPNKWKLFSFLFFLFLGKFLNLNRLSFPLDSHLCKHIINSIWFEEVEDANEWRLLSFHFLFGGLCRRFAFDIQITSLLIREALLLRLVIRLVSNCAINTLCNLHRFLSLCIFFIFFLRYLTFTLQSASNTALLNQITTSSN